MKIYKKTLTMILGGLMMAVNAASPFSAVNEKNLVSYMEASYTESKIRELAVINPDFAVEKFFSDGAAKKWLALTDNTFSKEQMRDFFFGAILFRGPVSKSGSIVAFYNPWWDTILISECYETDVVVNGKNDKIRKINDFYFLSGLQFRGEVQPSTYIAEQLASNKNPLSYTVCSLFFKTKNKFEKMYGQMSTPLLLEHPDDRTPKNIEQIQACSALRLKMVSLFVSNKDVYKEAWQLVPILQKGKKSAFDLLFSSEYAKMMSSYFVTLPAKVRADFEPYSYYPDKNKKNVRGYVYVNSKYPRLFAVMYLGLGYGNTVFEWFDFAQSDSIIQAFEQAKEKSK